MKTVTIPMSNDPYTCEINGVKYYYAAGSTVEVPDEVAALIQANAGNRKEPEYKPDIVIPKDGEVDDVLTRTAYGAAWKAPSGGDGSGVLEVGYDFLTGALDKTWQEINDAPFAVIKREEEGKKSTDIVITTMVAEDIFIVGVAEAEGGESSVSWSTKGFSANSADAYPVEMG